VKIVTLGGESCYILEKACIKEYIIECGSALWRQNSLKNAKNPDCFLRFARDTI